MMLYAEKLLGKRSAMLAAVSGRSAVRGVLRLGVAETIVHTWLTRLIGDVSGRYPDLSLEIEVNTTPTLCERLLAQEIDLAFVVAPLTAPELRSRGLCDYPIGFLASPSLGIGEGIQTIYDLARFPIITFPRKTQPHELVSSLFSQPDVPIIQLHAIASLATMIHMAVEGLGIAVIPTAIAKRELQDGRLLLLSTDLRVPKLVFEASWLASPDALTAELIADLAVKLARTKAPKDDGE